jgi:hypothetical protein
MSDKDPYNKWQFTGGALMVVFWVWMLLVVLMCVGAFLWAWVDSW